MKYYVIDAFADELFRGNPAGVCLLNSWPETALMQCIAAENNLSETAFVVPEGERFGLKWFTPEEEMDLCGHATLAAAFALAHFVNPSQTIFRFDTVSGPLQAEREGERFVLDFPSRKPVPMELTPAMSRAVGLPVREAHRSRDLMLVVESEEQVRAAAPDMEAVKALPDTFAVILTAEGETADFVSRFFAPGVAVPEDPVTGSAHSTLVPFWAERLGRKTLTARQVSRRGGTLYCEDKGERVSIAGTAKLYLTGEIHL